MTHDMVHKVFFGKGRLLRIAGMVIAGGLGGLSIVPSRLCGQVRGVSAAVEVASIRQHRFTGQQAGGRQGISISGNRIAVAGLSLWGLILYAYNVKDYQLSAGATSANWTAEVLYDIDAKAEGGGL